MTQREAQFLMPLLAGFYYAFPAACHTVYTKDILSNYPLRPDGFYTRNLDSLNNLVCRSAVQALSPPYFESFCQSLTQLRKYEIYTKSILESGYLIFTYKKTPLLVFDNASNEFSPYSIVIDMFYLVPHYISEEHVERRQLAEKRLKVITLFIGFLGLGFLKSG